MEIGQNPAGKWESLTLSLPAPFLILGATPEPRLSRGLSSPFEFEARATSARREDVPRVSESACGTRH